MSNTVYCIEDKIICIPLELEYEKADESPIKVSLSGSISDQVFSSGSFQNRFSSCESVSE